MNRALRFVAAVLVAVTAARCASHPPPEPPAVTTPKFADYVYPAPPPGLGTPAALERHDVGWRWLQSGDPRAAERNFAAALKQMPGFYPAEVGLGYVALSKKSPKDALLHFDRAVVANPRYAPALAGRAEALLAIGDQDKAVQSLEAALQADPSQPLLRSRLDVLKFRQQQDRIAAARKLAEAGRLTDAQAAYASLIEASPQSAFLYRELAEVERREGSLDAAAEHARRAAELEPDEARTHVLLADIHEAKGELTRAADELGIALTLQPDTALRERADALRARAAFEAMPAEYREIDAAPVVTRGQLAALIAVRLDRVVSQSRRVNAVVITDTRGHWASPYILSLARAGVMEVYANHTFQPDAVVRRGDLAQAASRVLELIAAGSPARAAAWANARTRKFPDVGPRHLSYPAVSLVVEAGVMGTLDDGSFRLAQPVTGAEAVAAVTKLQELGGQPGR